VTQVEDAPLLSPLFFFLLLTSLHHVFPVGAKSWLRLVVHLQSTPPLPQLWPKTGRRRMFTDPSPPPTQMGGVLVGRIPGERLPTGNRPGFVNRHLSVVDSGKWERGSVQGG
jgi:hypothetical protein